MHPIFADIEEELDFLRDEAHHLATALETFARRARTRDLQQQWEVTTLCASAAEKIYTGCERIMARIAREVDREPVPKDEGWHKALLERMRQPFPGRGAVLSPDTHARLDRMRAFRHVVRNTYGIDLDTLVVIERAHEALGTYERFSADIRRWLETL